MICEVRGVFPTVLNNARSVRGRPRAAGGGRTPQGSAAQEAGGHPGPHARLGIPTHTRVSVFLPGKKCQESDAGPQ